MKAKLTFLGFGALFGFILSRVGATDFDAIAQMFLLTDLHLAGVIGVAVVVAAVGLRLLRNRAQITPKPQKPGLMLGGLLFGAGWALTGACPGTALSQLGEGKLMALFTVAGILAGAALHRALTSAAQSRDSDAQVGASG